MTRATGVSDPTKTEPKIQKTLVVQPISAGGRTLKMEQLAFLIGFGR
jgi:hypothetical protein